MASTFGLHRPTKSFSLCIKPLSALKRREWLSGLVLGAPFLVVLDPVKVLAEDVTIASRAEMKSFEDPLFIVSVPKSFFTLRRTQKGDLPDAKTGKGRRGSSIFTAGNMAKAEVIAVEVSLLMASWLIHSSSFCDLETKACNIHFGTDSATL